MGSKKISRKTNKVYTEFVGARVKLKDKVMLDKSGYSVRDAVEYFNKQTTDELKRYEIEREILNDKLLDLEKSRIAEEKELMRRIDAVNFKLGTISIDGFELNELTSNALKIAENAYSNKKDEITFEEFLTQKEDFLKIQADSCNMGLLEFKMALGKFHSIYVDSEV